VLAAGGHQAHMYCQAGKDSLLVTPSDHVRSTPAGGITLDQLEQSFFRQQQGAAAPEAPPAAMASAAAPSASLPLGMVPPGGQMGGMPGAPPMQFPFYGQQPGFMPLGAGAGQPGCVY
jgi:hypothetical protein